MSSLWVPLSSLQLSQSCFPAIFSWKWVMEKSHIACMWWSHLLTHILAVSTAYYVLSTCEVMFTAPGSRTDGCSGQEESWKKRTAFKPLSLAPFHQLTWKTFCLVTVSKATWVSEIHALSTDLSCLGFWGKGFSHGQVFLAKNRLTLMGPQEVTLHPLSRKEPVIQLGFRIQCVHHSFV